MSKTYSKTRTLVEHPGIVGSVEARIGIRPLRFCQRLVGIGMDGLLRIFSSLVQA